MLLWTGKYARNSHFSFRIFYTEIHKTGPTLHQHTNGIENVGNILDQSEREYRERSEKHICMAEERKVSRLFTQQNRLNGNFWRETFFIFSFSLFHVCVCVCVRVAKTIKLTTTATEVLSESPFVLTCLYLVGPWDHGVAVNLKLEHKIFMANTNDRKRERESWNDAERYRFYDGKSASMASTTTTQKFFTRLCHWLLSQFYECFSSILIDFFVVAVLTIVGMNEWTEMSTVHATDLYFPFTSLLWWMEFSICSVPHRVLPAKSTDSSTAMSKWMRILEFKLITVESR